jgi:DNA-binding NarL/FixJ family response regulator
MKIRVAIVEDTDDIRNGLAMIINGTEGFSCEHVFCDAEQALVNIPKHKPDIVLMDIDLPGMNGISCIEALRELCPTTQFMMLTVYEDDDKIFRSLQAGATGYLLKKTSPTQLLDSIKDLYNGGSPMNTQIARRVVASFQKTPPPKIQHAEGLTKRELELLDLLSKGYRYKDISEKLFISSDTVRTHIRNIYVKLQVRSKIEAINKVFDR